jgi:predicted RNA methylase
MYIDFTLNAKYPDTFAIHGHQGAGMYNSSFYPTPPEVAARMLERIDPAHLRTRLILEPSAGKGDLADAIVARMSGDYEELGIERPFMSRHDISRYKDKVHCLEIEPDLIAALHGKQYKVVGHDFLSFVPDQSYDLIIMNPPFHEADKHVLKAWEILHDGEIICLLNEQTLYKTATTVRRQLARLVEEHGEIISLGSCFVDAERKTDVRVACIHLKKEGARMEFSFGDFKSDYGVQDDFDMSSTEGQVATRNVVGNMVLEYNKSLEIAKELCRLTAELAYYSRHLQTNYGSCIKTGLTNALESLFSGTPSEAKIKESLRSFTVALKTSAWSQVFSLGKFENLMSKSVKSGFEEMQRQNSNLAFSEENIFQLFQTIWSSRDNILQQCVLDAFDVMTKHHHENREAIQGWKTNDAWRVNRKVILDWFVDKEDSKYPWGYARLNYTRYNELNDIDRALASLEGKKLEDIASIHNIFHGNKIGFGTIAYSEYFEIKAYKKGSLHLYFRDKDLWERFNIAAAEGKNWLPDDFKAREKAKRKAKHEEEKKTKQGANAAQKSPDDNASPLAITADAGMDVSVKVEVLDCYTAEEAAPLSVVPEVLFIDDTIPSDLFEVAQNAEPLQAIFEVQALLAHEYDAKTEIAMVDAPVVPPMDRGSALRQLTLF